MDPKKLEIYFFSTLTIAALVLFLFLFLPFFTVLVLAITLSIICEPLFRFILKIIHKPRSLAALLTIFLMLLVVLVPLTFIGIEVFNQAQNLYGVITTKNINANALAKAEVIIESKIQKIIPKGYIDLNLVGTINSSFKWVGQNIGPIFSGLTHIATSFLLSLIGLYYFLKDGNRLKKYLFRVIPLSDEHNEIIFSRLRSTVVSVIRGNLVVAVIQGTLAGIGFTIFGVPNSIFWGFITAIAALIPIVGTSVILVPAIAYLFVFKDVGNGIGLLAWGMIAVGLIDNFIGPKIIEKKIQIHPFLILLSILGGIGLFGPIGLLAGPICLALFLTLINLYPSLVLKRQETQHSETEETEA
jgi:predicted PurR-regulated permease PerM